MTKTCVQMSVVAFLALGVLGVARGADQPPPGEWKETAVLKGHGKSVSTLAFSPDGETLASVDGGGVLKLWDVAAGKAKATAGGKGQTILAVRFAANGETLATVSAEGIVTVWDGKTGKQRSAVRLGLRDAVLTAAFSPDGKLLATTAGNVVEQQRVAAEVQFWDPATGRKKGVLTGDWLATGQLHFAPDGKTLVGSCERAVLKPGDPLCTSEYDLKFWDVSGARIKEVRTLSPGAFFTLSPDGKTLAAAATEGKGNKVTGFARVWDAATGKELAVCKGHPDAVGALGFSPDGKLLATGAGDKMLKVWDAAAGKELAALQHPTWVTSVAFAPDGRTLATACDDQTVRLWSGTQPSPGERPEKK